MVELLVSEQELAETYDPETGWETVQQYREAHHLSDTQDDFSQAEIARQVGRPPSAVRGWLVEDKTPRVVKGLETARGRGWIEFESISERFRAMNQLVAWLFGGGGISRKHYLPTFSVDDQLALATLDRLLRWINIPYRVRAPDDPDRHLEVVPSEAASVFGRVAHVLGVPRGQKAGSENLTLPGYLRKVAQEHRRDFVRIYILNRGGPQAFDDGAGLYVGAIESDSYARALRELVESVTAGTATVSSQSRVWISAESVRDLAGETPLRSALATRAAFGAANPPTERAFAATAREETHPGGYRYLQLYRHVQKSDASLEKVSDETGIPKSTVYGWRRDVQPYVKNALDTATNRGWITPSEDDIALGLTGLMAWLFARGTLDTRNYYPVFRLQSAAQEDSFEPLAASLDLSYSLARQDSSHQMIEIRPDDDGTVLGRVLYALGAPITSEKQNENLPPVYLYHRPPHAREFVTIWCDHYGEGEDELTITVPPRLGSQFPKALNILLREQLGWSTTHTTDREIVAVPDW